MHLRGYPKYFIKGAKRRAVYYTADASALLAMGWVPEEKVSAVAESKPEAKPGPKPESKTDTEAAAPKVEVEVVEEEIEEEITGEELPDFEFLTKAELIKYAADHGETLQPTSLKSELIEACKKLVRARDDQGRFVGDDPTTPEVNEAWTIG